MCLSGFKHLSDALDGKPDQNSLLHICENVHMFIFVSMILNFAILGYLIHRMMMWQLLFAGWEHDLEHKTSKIKPPTILFNDFLAPEDTCSCHILGWKMLKRYFIEVCLVNDQEDALYIPEGVVLTQDFDFSRSIY